MNVVMVIIKESPNLILIKIAMIILIFKYGHHYLDIFNTIKIHVPSICTLPK